MIGEVQMDLIDHKNNGAIKKSVGEVLVERTGKVEETEVYSNSKEILMVFPNDYSVTIKEKNSRKHVEVKVYLGVGEVTNRFFVGRSNRKVRADSIMAFIDRVEKL